MLKLQAVTRTAKAAMLATGPLMTQVAEGKRADAATHQLAELNDAIRDLSDAREALELCRKVLQNGGVGSDDRRHMQVLTSMQVRA
jgi:hypothetical protein